MGASPVGLPIQPTKQQAGGSVPSSGPVSFNPGSASPSQANPYAPAGAVPQSLSTSTVPTGTVQTNGINWADGSNTVTGDFKDTYGAGTGTAISDVLQNMGTVNDSAIQATIANTDLAAGKQYANIQSGEAASGVTANSSTAALASGDFYSGVNSQLQSTIANSEVNEEDTLLSTLVGEGTAHGPDSSTLDNVMNGIGDAASIATSVGEVAMGIPPTGSGIPTGSSSFDTTGQADIGF